MLIIQHPQPPSINQPLMLYQEHPSIAQAQLTRKDSQVKLQALPTSRILHHNQPNGRSSQKVFSRIRRSGWVWIARHHPMLPSPTIGDLQVSLCQPLTSQRPWHFHLWVSHSLRAEESLSAQHPTLQAKRHQQLTLSWNMEREFLNLVFQTASMQKQILHLNLQLKIWRTNRSSKHKNSQKCKKPEHLDLTRWEVPLQEVVKLPRNKSWMTKLMHR